MSRRVLGQQFTRQALRDDMYLAQHAQKLREENATSGHKTEAKAFYGHSNAPQSDDAEQRLTVRAADREHAARRAHEDEQARTHVPMSDAERDDIHRKLEEAGW